MLVIVGTRTNAHSLRSQVGIGSESDCLLKQLERILRISDSETGLKEENRIVSVNGNLCSAPTPHQTELSEFVLPK